jgi:hypothetical protein
MTILSKKNQMIPNNRRIVLLSIVKNG